MDSLTIHLAGQPFKIAPLTVGQLEDLHVGVVKQNDGSIEETTRQFWKQNIALLAVALREDHPNMTEDTIRKMRLGSIKKVKEAVDQVLVFSGLIEDKPKEGVSPGEAVAGAE